MGKFTSIDSCATMKLGNRVPVNEPRMNTDYCKMELFYGCRVSNHFSFSRDDTARCHEHLLLKLESESC